MPESANHEIQWIELLSSDRANIERLGRELGIHPLAVEDCFNSNQRAKFEDFENHQLLVWFALVEGEIYELEFVIFPRMLILVTADPAPKGASWREYLKLDRTHRDANHMLYQVLDRTMDASAHSVRPLVEAIDEFEQSILQAVTDPHQLMQLKRQLSQAEFALSYLSSVAGQWQRFLNPKDDLRWRLRDLWDHCERFHQSLVFARTQIAGSMEMYWGMTAKRTNDQIKKLTLVASISVPLTFWSGFWGMNFEAIPFKEPWLFYLALGMMFTSVTAVFFLLKRKGYWEKE